MSSIYDNYPAVRYVDEYDKDTDEQCVRCKGNCGFIGVTGMWACKGFVPMTNADRIRAMSDEELADFIGGIFTIETDIWGDYDPRLIVTQEPRVEIRDKEGMMEWLKSPVEVDNGG